MWQLCRLSQPMVLSDVSLNCSALKEVKANFVEKFSQFYWLDFLISLFNLV